jgi:hypothetical protein
MIGSGKFKDDFIRRKIFKDRLPAILITILTLYLVYFFAHKYLIYAGAALFILFLADLPGLIRSFNHHHQLMNWLDRNREITLFVYSSKVRYMDLIEKHVLPLINEKILVLKIMDGRVKGNIRRTVWYELSRRSRIHHLPVIIKLDHRYYQVIPFRRFLNEYIDNQIDDKLLIEKLSILLEQPIIVPEADLEQFHKEYSR